VTSTKQLLAIVAVCQTVFCPAAFTQTQGIAVRAIRMSNVRSLLRELRWNDVEGRTKYLQTKDDTTRDVLREVDGFIGESVSPRTATLDQVKAGLDALLGHSKGEGIDSEAFSANLSGRHFLVIGVEVRRGGSAMSEDAMSFRGYRETENRFVLVANTEYTHIGDTSGEGWEPLADLEATALPRSPIASEFWFIAWAQVPSLAPPTVTVRLFAFDGDRFRAVWTTEDFTTPYVNRAVQVTQDGGFTLSRMPDPHGNRVLIAQYTLTADGPQKVSEEEGELR
jgi:hypothetical protein